VKCLCKQWEEQRAARSWSLCPTVRRTESSTVPSTAKSCQLKSTLEQSCNNDDYGAITTTTTIAALSRKQNWRIWRGNPGENGENKKEIIWQDKREPENKHWESHLLCLTDPRWRQCRNTFNPSEEPWMSSSRYGYRDTKIRFYGATKCSLKLSLQIGRAC